MKLQTKLYFASKTLFSTYGWQATHLGDDGLWF